MRLIDADALIQKVKEEEEERHLDKDTTAILQFLIEEYAELVDAVKVVRCKDCKHTYLSDNFGITAPWLMCKRHIGNTYKVNEDDFCSWAERKTVTITAGKVKAKNVAKGKKAYTADMSVLKVRKGDDKVEEKEE